MGYYGIFTCIFLHVDHLHKYNEGNLLYKFIELLCFFLASDLALLL